MFPLQATKVVGVIMPTALVDNAEWTTVEIDTLGFDYCQVYFYIGTSDIAVAALAIKDGDVSGTVTNVTGLIVGTSDTIAGATSVLPSATDDGDIWRFDIDLRYRKRYIDLFAQAGDGSVGSNAAAWAILSRAREAPTTAAQSGCNQILRV